MFVMMFCLRHALLAKLMSLNVHELPPVSQGLRSGMAMSNRRTM